jgi:hypothetical protein
MSFLNTNHSFSFRKPAGRRTAGAEFALSAQMMISPTWLLIDRTRLLLNLPQPKIRRHAFHEAAGFDSTPRIQ